MTDETLIVTLKKWEAYLMPLQRTITPDLWPYYKKWGCLPPLPKEEELKTRLLTGGINKQLVLDDFMDGIINMEELTEALDLFFEKKWLEEYLDELSWLCGFGEPSDAETKMFDALFFYLEGESPS